MRAITRIWTVAQMACLVLVVFASWAFATPGDLDDTFGRNGIVRTRFMGSAEGTAVAIAPDGKIAVGGLLTPLDGGKTRFAVARYNSDGTLDATFGGTGKVKTAFLGPHGYLTSANLYGLAVQPDGKILAAGFTCCDAVRFALARYEVDGSLDEDFGDGGTVTTSFPGRAEAFGVALQPDGRIVVSGEIDWGALALVRYAEDGSLDDTFGGDGRVTGATGFVGATPAIQDDGKIVVCGMTFGTASGQELGVARFEPGGEVDAAFGQGGVATTDLASDTNGASDVAIQSDGGIVAVGYVWTGDSVLARWDPNGALDTTFSTDGVARVRAIAYAVSIQADGRIVAAGHTKSDVPAVARYLAT